MNRFKTYLQTHPNIVKSFTYTYIVFAGCFTFPLWSEKFPLDWTRIYLVVVEYGVIALALASIYGIKKEKIVCLQTFALTMIGLICRYFLEFGEHSNTYNFTLINIILYILVVPVYTMIAYHFIVKSLTKQQK